MTDSNDQPTEVFSRRAAREESAKAAASARPAGGLRAVIAQHPTVWLFSALGVVFLLLATGALFAGIASGSGTADAVPLPTESAPPPRPQPSAVPAGTHLRTCSIASTAAQPNLGTLAASVIDTSTGEVLFDRAGTTPASPANVTQLLTAASAIKILGASTQLSTKVMLGSSAGTIVLVGGGDPTLATTPDSVYEGAPLISDLATSAMAAYKAAYPKASDKITQIVLDTSLWNSSDNWNPGWATSERSNGYMSLITPLMVDGDRDDPTDDESARGDDPVMRAGQAFAAAAGLSGVTFSTGSAIGSTVLAEVKSQPVSTLVGQMLMTGDNTLAEMLARVMAKRAQLDGSSASVTQIIPATLKDLGLDTTGLVIADGSGESASNAVPPQLIAQLLVKVKANEADLGSIYAGMPVAGQSGNLYDRFADSPASGKVVGVTGWITNERSLAGIINAADGTALAFAFYGLGDAISTDTKAALDALASAAFTCGANLSTN